VLLAVILVMIGLVLLVVFQLFCCQGHETAFYGAGRAINITVDQGIPQIFKIRGFSYSNSRIGEGAPSDGSAGEFDSLMRPKICKQDFDLMRALNANLIKVYAFNVNSPDSAALHQECLDYAWNNGTKPIFVLLSIWITTLPFPDELTRQKFVQEYATMASQTNTHPAVFGYSVGSEISGDPNNNPPYWQDFSLLVDTLRSNLGSSRKIITTGTYQSDCANPPVPVLGHVINGEAFGVKVDAWGVDIYSPNPNEPTLRKNIYTYTKKPLFFPEYGLTFQPSFGDEYKLSQQLLSIIGDMEQYAYNTNNFNVNQGGTYDPNGPIYAGGLVFEWIDEYWKAPLGSNCQPNPSSAQAYYGVNKVALKAGCTCVNPPDRSPECYLDDRIPRPILDPTFLPTLWTSYEPSIQLRSHPTQ